MQLPLATGLKAEKGIELLTWGTPNGIISCGFLFQVYANIFLFCVGFKASIMLEELKEAYGIEYTVQAITLPKGVQKQQWYLELNPNGKIPTIVDHDLGGISVGESGGMFAHMLQRR
jgi:glutathione S-transferase